MELYTDAGGRAKNAMTLNEENWNEESLSGVTQVSMLLFVNTCLRGHSMLKPHRPDIPKHHMRPLTTGPIIRIEQLPWAYDVCLEL